MKKQFFLILLLLLVALAPNIDAAVTGSFTHTLRGQILDLNPTFGSDVTYYRWIIRDNNSVTGETCWIPISENCSTKYQLDQGMDYQVTLGYKNITESGETAITLHVSKTEDDDDTTTLAVADDVESPYKKFFGDYSPEINKWFADRNPGEWFIFFIVAVLAVFMLYSYKKNKKKKYFVVTEVKKNVRK